MASRGVTLGELIQPSKLASFLQGQMFASGHQPPPSSADGVSKGKMMDALSIFNFLAR